MPESRRATAALAGLIALALAMVGLVVLHVGRMVPATAGAVASLCRVPGAGTGPDLATLIVTPAWWASGLLVGSLVYALVRLARTLWGIRQILTRLAAVPLTATASAGTERVALRAARLEVPVSPVVADLDGRPAAFTVGLLRPGIVVTAAVVEALDDEELDALLLHEAGHIRRRDPLRLLVGGFCRDLVVLLPIGHTLFRLACEAQERAADDEAAAKAGPLEVAGALIACLRLAGRRPEVRLAPAAVGADPEARIRRLLGAADEPRSRRGRVPRAGATLLVSAVLLAGLAVLPARAGTLAAAGCCALIGAGLC